MGVLEAIKKQWQAWLSDREPGTLGLALSGGGARSVYQAGVMRYIAEAFPEVSFPIMTGVSAGAINTSHLANYDGSFRDATSALEATWLSVTPEQVFRAESSFSLLRRIVQRAGNGDSAVLTEGGALVDTEPLRTFLRTHLQTDDGVLRGITDNVRSGRLQACAIVTTNYMTGQTVTWIQGAGVQRWQRPNRLSVHSTLTIDHIMASTALPLIFPAIRIADAWYGDGGIRLTAPLSPAIHLGADRILAVSTRYNRSRAEADQPSIIGYPPAAQIIGMLMNAIFLDLLDQDALMLERINDLIGRIPAWKRGPLRPISLLMIRPSVDLGRMASNYEMQVSGALSLISRALGSDATKSPDWLSMLLFEKAYMARLCEIGYDDAKRQHPALETFLEGKQERGVLVV